MENSEPASKTSKPREPSGPDTSPSSVTNSDRIRAAQRGDVIAMSELLDALMPLVGRLCGSIALDAGPDAAQETMIQVMRDLEGLRDPAALTGWVRRIATREAIRQAQRARREPSFEHLERTYADQSSRPHLDPMLARDVERVLSELPTDQRTILVLRDLEGLSEGEAASLLGVARGTIKSRLHRARDAFRKRWPA